MKKFLMCLSFLVCLNSFAKDINVGDLVTFEISGVEKNELTDIFTRENLHIENIQEVDGKGEEKKYKVGLRFFKTGIEKFIIKNKVLEVEVKSLLNGEKEIYPNLSDNSEKKLYSPNFPILSLISFIIILYSTYSVIKNRKKKIKELSSEEIFLQNMNLLSQDRWNFEISENLRRYIDSKYESNFLSGIYIKIDKIGDEDIIFLEELDIGKFSTKKIEDRELCVKRAMDIFYKIEEGGKDV